MKFNFKRIASVLTGAVMLSSTLALAAAAANQFPEPFVKSGSADVAVVYGSNVQVAQTDIDSAMNIARKLNNYVVAASVTPSASTPATTSGEGDQYLLEKTSTKFHIGKGAVDVVAATVDDDELPTLLADGKFVDDDSDDFDFTQKITLANFSVSMFEDNDYKEDEPTVGIRIASGDPVLNYTLEFSDQPEFADLETSDLEMMGKEYYVLDNGTSTTTPVLTLLDSAEKVVLRDGETKTVTINGKAYEAKIAFIGTSEVRLDINGQVTSSLAEQQTYKLRDGTYVGIRDISVQDYAGGSKQVEFGIGRGKLKLTSGSDVEMNDDSVSRLKSYITASGSKLSTIVLEWKADGDQFVAPGKEAVMPGFGNLKLAWSGYSTPASENITIKYGGDDYAVLDDFPIKNSVEDIFLVYSTDDANFTGVGKDATNILRTSGTNELTFDADTDEYFIVSWRDSGNKDVESYVMRATGFKREDGINKTTFEYKKDGSWVAFKTDRKPGDTVSIGNVDLTLSDTSYDGKNATLTYTGTQHSFNTLYSKEGLKIILPWTNTTSFNVSTQIGSPSCTNNASLAFKAGQSGPVTLTNVNGNVSVTCYQTTWKANIFEEDKDETVGSGDNINVTLGFNSASTPAVSVTAIAGGDGTDTEIGSTDVFRNFVYSALGTEYLWSKGGDQDWVKLVYHGSESKANVYLTSSGVVVDNGDGVVNTGIPQLTDAQVATQAPGKNLIVVGGSCINTVAATLLGSSTPLCGEDFTRAAQTKVGRAVGPGSYLIAAFDSPYNANKTAMLVAGWEAQDTVNAASYLTTQAENVSTLKGDAVVNGAKVTISG
ncbi:MAG: hypothetical protein Q8Q31_00100 [Nanoarchaeota archaeon]|nr:hypothetical protein [Nanoarchaeota archaeon]